MDPRTDDSERKLVVAAVGEREVTMTRSFAAPRPMVFDAFTRPEQVQRWYGEGNGWSMERCQIDLRVGGAWRYVLQGPQGMKMGVHGVFREIVAPERLVTTESYDDGEGHPLQGRLTMYPGEAINTLSLVQRGGLTTMTIRILYPGQEDRDRILRSGMEHGASLSYDNLERLLAGARK